MGSMSSELTVVKLGGSLITNKDRPLALNMHGIDSSVRAIARSLRSNKIGRLFLIHGGGSFGHYYARKFFLSTTRKQIPADGVSRVAASMITLHSVVLDRLVREGVPCKTVMTSEFLSSDGRSVSRNGKRILEDLFQCGFVPISFGNVSVTMNGSVIISGDQIALSLAKGQNVKRAIFAMDVDGVYNNSQMNGNVIKDLNAERFKLGKQKKFDVTGGIRTKIQVGLRLASLGTDVFYVNGTKGRRLESLLIGQDDVVSTKIHSKRI
jgi:isopentenyl phosphate kinase